MLLLLLLHLAHLSRPTVKDPRARMEVLMPSSTLGWLLGGRQAAIKPAQIVLRGRPVVACLPAPCSSSSQAVVLVVLLLVPPAAVWVRLPAPQQQQQ